MGQWTCVSSLGPKNAKSRGPQIKSGGHGPTVQVNACLVDNFQKKKKCPTAKMTNSETIVTKVYTVEVLEKPL